MGNDPNPLDAGTNKWNLIVSDSDQDVIDPNCTPPGCPPHASWYQGHHQGDIHHPYPTNACWENPNTWPYEKFAQAKCNTCLTDCNKCIAENCPGATCADIDSEGGSCEEKCKARCTCLCHPDPKGGDPYDASSDEGKAQVWVYGCNNLLTTPCQKECSIFCLELWPDNPAEFDQCIASCD
ncbi:MAG: hypothetical protein COS84_09455, partial [Armatimonadetes bacterium CG07_land_8_20_14_0_80_40_9]